MSQMGEGMKYNKSPVGFKRPHLQFDHFVYFMSQMGEGMKYNKSPVAFKRPHLQFDLCVYSLR